MKLQVPTPAAVNEQPPDRSITSAARALPAGTRLNEFEIEDVIGEGSVAIVYAATDRAHAVPVTIAEYMPARLAQRDDRAQVTPRTSAHADAFAKGLKAFVNEARTLARCEHPSLVRVVCLCEANATAYRVMPRHPARRLLEVRQGMNEPPDEAALRALLDALLGALEVFHRAVGYHGKVTPSNILLQDDDRPLLLGPGAAGRAIGGEMIDALMTSREPCFAPIEQVVEADMPLHPSVDLYSLAGVARYWMSGRLPPPVFGAPGAARHETVAGTVQRLRLTWPRLCYSASLVGALDTCLSIYPAERPQSVAQMRARLEPAPPSAGRSLSAGRTPVAELDDPVPSSPAPAPARTAFAYRVPNHRRIAMWSGALLMLLVLLLIGVQGVRPDRPVGRVLDFLGIGRGTGSRDSAAMSASIGGAAAPATPQNAADSEAAKPMPTGPNAEDSPAGASAPASPAGPNLATPTTPATAAAVAVARSPATTAARVAKKRPSHAPASPREACGARTQFSMYRCMQMQCSQARWAAHAQCEYLRTTDSVD